MLGTNADPDPDLNFHFDALADPDPDPTLSFIHVRKSINFFLRFLKSTGRSGFSSGFLVVIYLFHQIFTFLNLLYQRRPLKARIFVARCPILLYMLWARRPKSVTERNPLNLNIKGLKEIDIIDSISSKSRDFRKNSLFDFHLWSILVANYSLLQKH